MVGQVNPHPESLSIEQRMAYAIRYNKALMIQYRSTWWDYLPLILSIGLLFLLDIIIAYDYMVFVYQDPYGELSTWSHIIVWVKALVILAAPILIKEVFKWWFAKTDETQLFSPTLQENRYRLSLLIAMSIMAILATIFTYNLSSASNLFAIMNAYHELVANGVSSSHYTVDDWLANSLVLKWMMPLSVIVAGWQWAKLEHLLDGKKRIYTHAQQKVLELQAYQDRSKRLAENQIQLEGLNTTERQGRIIQHYQSILDAYFEGLLETLNMVFLNKHGTVVQAPSVLDSIKIELPESIRVCHDIDALTEKIATCQASIDAMQKQCQQDLQAITQNNIAPLSITEETSHAVD